LFGQTYSFRTNEENVHIEKIVRYVADEVEKAKASGEMPSRLDSVILAALNIASNYFDLKHHRDMLIEDIDRRCKALVEYIDNNS
jgi:cell division protein ZapA (FtsZ GTPase activity inhibitor)